MKKLIVCLMLASAGSANANSQYAGKLDLNYDFQAICYRNLYDGMWMTGAQKQVWHLQYLPRDVEVLHASAYYASHLGGPGQSYGLSAGFNIGAGAYAVLREVEAIASVIDSAPPWLLKVDQWISVDFYGGYAPHPGVDQRNWDYGVGGKVKVPADMLVRWAVGADPANGKKGL